MLFPSNATLLTSQRSNNTTLYNNYYYTLHFKHNDKINNINTIDMSEMINIIYFNYNYTSILIIIMYLFNCNYISILIITMYLFNCNYISILMKGTINIM
jgi:hypothetical protein